MNRNAGAETFIAMTPEAIRAKEAIYKFDYAKRQCYLESDRDLHFYRHYSFLNCYMECSSNVTFKVGTEGECVVCDSKNVLSSLLL